MRNYKFTNRIFLSLATLGWALAGGNIGCTGYDSNNDENADPSDYSIEMFPPAIIERAGLDIDATAVGERGSLQLLERECQENRRCIAELAEALRSEREFFHNIRQLKIRVRRGLRILDPGSARELSRALSGWDLRRSGPEMAAILDSIERLLEAVEYYREHAPDLPLTGYREQAYELAGEVLVLSVIDLKTAANGLWDDTETESVVENRESSDNYRQIALKAVDISTGLNTEISTAQDLTNWMVSVGLPAVTIL